MILLSRFIDEDALMDGKIMWDIFKISKWTITYLLFLGLISSLRTFPKDTLNFKYEIFAF